MLKQLPILMILLFSFSVFAANLYTFDGEFKTELSLPYFYMTDFYNQYKYCYTVESSKACDLVKEGESITMTNYTEGAHDYFEVLSCTNNYNLVTVKANLYNDYDNNFRQREVSFGQCD